MVFEATYRHGDYVAVDYTPAAGNISAGQVVLVGNTAGWTCGIAHHDIENGTLGSLAAGGGVYEVISAGNYNNGAKVYWDDSANKVTTTSTNNATFGFLVGAGVTNTAVKALHKPYV